VHKFFKNIAMKHLMYIFSLIIFISFGCNKDEEETEVVFDRGAMLTNYAENLVIPAYEDALASLGSLKASIEDFSNNQNIEQLENMQSNWILSYEDWQFASIYNFGPAAEQGLSKSLNEEIATFPVAANKINEIVETGQYNLEDFNRDARGFLAVEYLIFAGLETSNNDILNLFTNEAYRLDYLKVCADHMIVKIENVLDTWRNSYTSQFIQNNGTDAGSSTSELYNEFVKSFETIKNFKVELPLGLRPGQTQVEPQLVQAYYSGHSLDMLKKHIEAIENTYFGKSKSGSVGIGFNDYLESVVGGVELVDQTLAQWENVINALYSVPTEIPISEQVTNSPQPFKDFGEELQKHTRFFKSDMSSRLGIAITYSSGDGD
jgi:predicted lipoprotein